jgi:hypothetical protein
MKLKITLLFIAFISICNLKAQTVKIGATTYGTITEAITAAVDGDIIDITGIHTEPISISKSITLRGIDPTTDIIQAAATEIKDGTGSRVISLVPPLNTDVLTITIENLGIRHGNFNANGGGINSDKIMGLLTLNNLIIKNNYTTTNGGALGIAGSNATIINCTIQNNTSLLDGGAIIGAPNNNSGNGINSVINIKQSLIDSNNGRNGGGMYINGNNNFGNNYKIDVNFENSTIANNTTTSASGGNGGGTIFTASANLVGSNPLISNVSLKLVHTTVYNNTHAALAKSGLQFAGTNKTNFSAFNSIIVSADDVATKALNFLNTNTTDVINCILGGLENAGDYLGIIDDSNKNNLKGQTATQAGLTGTLTTEGGKTQVLAITESSKADDFCTATVPFSLPTVDQRGATREGVADAGAYEFGGTLSITKNNFFDGLNIYPNPASTIVRINGVENIESIKVFSILGSLEMKAVNTDYLDVSNLSTGIYFIQVTKGNFSTTKKLIIK